MQLSGAQTVLYVILAVLFAFVGYRLSENFRKQTGRTPWGMPSALWAFVWFLSLLLGLVLYLIARSTTKIDPSRRPASPMTRPKWPPGTTATTQSGSALPGRYPSRVASGDESPSPAPGPPAAHAVSPPMWHPDPSGRFEYRWWDGQRWTSSVSRGGIQLDDPTGN
ncbi:MAG TPA: DUF2510 domain-containing protein [Acidimicrobiales bacterium]|jgi:hypothetical protein|nr:DUF2510 domain-containing protein [Acidimicrobiales bacterium]